MDRMSVAILGGTGQEGRGLARRWAAAGVPVIIGSRDAGRARLAASELSRETGHPVAGEGNLEAAGRAGVVVLCVPFSAHRDTLLAVAGLVRDKVVVDVAVPLAPGNPTQYAPPPEGSALAEAQAVLGPGCRVVGAFQTVAAHDLNSDRPLEADVLVTGDDPGARRTVVELVRRMGARAVEAGGLEAAAQVEALTPLLIRLNQAYRKRGIGIRFTGI